MIPSVLLNFCCHVAEANVHETKMLYDETLPELAFDVSEVSTDS